MPKPKLVRHDSSHTERVRSNNLPIVVRLNGEFEIHWAKQFSDSSVDLFSSDESRVSKKTPWGSIRDVKFESRLNRKGDMGDYLVAENSKAEDVAFKINEIKVLEVLF